MDNKPTIAGRGPIVVKVEPGNYAWCSCGNSKNQPYCDGSHRGGAFRPLMTKIDEAKQVAFCACKQTKNPPFCDGSHRALPPG